ncbi:MAG: hypothetical protein HQ591_10910 [candidate division Zixibacteria bacterium]|nr:hypothetical protein [Candidatus Tariuqbacter arcticus]
MIASNRSAKFPRLGFYLFWAALLTALKPAVTADKASKPAVIWLFPAPVQIPTETAAELRRPNAVEIDDDGNIYLADTGNNRLLKLDRNLQIIAKTSGWGSERDLLNTPLDITIDSGLNLFAADYLNGRIVRFDGNLNFLWEVKINLLHDAWDYPLSLALSSWGELFILEESAGNVIQLHPAANTASVFGGFKPGQANLTGAKRLTISDDGKLYIANPEDKSVITYDRYGNFLRNVELNLPVQSLDSEGGFLWLAGSDQLACLRGGDFIEIKFIESGVCPTEIVDIAANMGILTVLTAESPFLLVYRLSRSPSRVVW